MQIVKSAKRYGVFVGCFRVATKERANNSKIQTSLEGVNEKLGRTSRPAPGLLTKY